MMMSTINRKISWPLLAAFIGATVGALNGQFVWALIVALGLWALTYVAQNLTSIIQRTKSANDLSTLVEGDGAEYRSIEKIPDWLRKWKEELHYSPAYKGTPGNIWNGSKWTSDD